MKRRLSIILALCLTLSMLLTACGSSKTAQGTTAGTTVQNTSTVEETTVATTQEAAIKGKVTFINSRVDFEDKFKEISAAFKAKYPEAELEVELVKDMANTLKIRLASGDIADVFQFTTDIVPPGKLLADNLLPLDDLGYTNDTIAGYDAQSHVYEGKHYGLTEGFNVSGILASKKVLESAGVTDYPKTLDELYAVADKLKAIGVTPFGSMLKTQWPLGNFDTVAYGNMSGTSYEFFEKQVVGSEAPFALDTPYGKAFTFVRNLKDKGYFEKDMMSSDWDVLRLHMDKVGMLMLASYGIGALEGLTPAEIAFFPLPIDNSGTPISWRTPSWDIGISKKTTNPEAAKAFVKFYLEDSGYTDLIGMAPSVKSVTSSNAALDGFLKTNPRYVESEMTPEVLAKYVAIRNKAQVDNGKIYQEVLLNKDNNIGPILDNYNKKWAEAKKALGY